MPVWLQIVVASVSVLGFLGGVIALIYRKVHKAQNVANRPYPCQKVIDLEIKVDKQGEYLSSDRKRLEQLEKAEVQIKTELSGTSSDVKEIKANVNKILLMMIEKKSSL